MEIIASAPRRGCLTEKVRRLVIKTEDEAEQQFMARLFEALGTGGSVEVGVQGKKYTRMRIPGKR